MGCATGKYQIRPQDNISHLRISIKTTTSIESVYSPAKLLSELIHPRTMFSHPDFTHEPAWDGKTCNMYSRLSPRQDVPFWRPPRMSQDIEFFPRSNRHPQTAYNIQAQKQSTAYSPRTGLQKRPPRMSQDIEIFPSSKRHPQTAYNIQAQKQSTAYSPRTGLQKHTPLRRAPKCQINTVYHLQNPTSQILMMNHTIASTRTRRTAMHSVSNNFSLPSVEINESLQQISTNS
ncbi:unnamed protein product [Owenia fusiformis]|uniref:Uncharacterized protein n=1 Tax=Owenia fusiformis TaxID=6347 RepID=A0A8J1Y0G8_OWEFU|nr:unnamed protein product [Owenia fusiformis]